ncbi:type VI secretion system tip protein VgrG [Paraburkholderia humisilvae]|uniref:type VI secretion system Vgr family protein n=1 Tax=Paraburkholderia humisilvae TaxID=627669 RepID=UPI0031B5B9E7
MTIGTVSQSLSVVSFELEEALNQTYKLDLVVTSSDHAIDGGLCVGRRATFTIVEEGSVPSMPDPIEPVIEPARRVHGVVTRWERRSSSRDETAYGLRIEPRFALLEHVHDSGVFRDVSVRELIRECIVDRELFDPHDIEFNLEGTEEKFEQTVMYEETVKGFIERHCRRAGIYYYFKQGRSGPRRDTLVFGNNPRGYVRSIELPWVPDSGLVADWHEAVLSVGSVRELVPAEIGVWDRNYRLPDASLEAGAIVARDDRSVFGRVNRSIEHHHTVESGRMLVEARRDEQVAKQQTLYGTSNALGMMPGVVVKLTNLKLTEAPYGLLITRLKTKGSRSAPVFNEFEATPAHLTWRPEYDPARHWRWVSGALTAVVTSDSTQPYACLDEHGRYQVDPLFRKRSGKRGTHLMALRLLRPAASYQGGFHSPLLPDTEVRLVGTNGDIDRLFIAGALHDYAHPDVVHGGGQWYSRAVWRSPLLGAKIRFDDLKGREGLKAATVYMQTSVSLGFLVDSEKKQRGEGFEIATHAWGTVRGPKGLFLSADGLSGADAPQLEMSAARREQRSSLERVKALAESTAQAKATAADMATQADLTEALDELKAPGLLASAPGGIALVTPKSIQHAASENVIMTAGRHADFSVVERFTLAVGELISLCAHKLGLKLTAAKGKVEIQAQSDALDLFAEKRLHLASAREDVLVAGKKKIALTSGGASITIENGNVEIRCPGEFRIKAASFTFEGPQSDDTPLPSLPQSELKPVVDYLLTH